MAATSLSPFHVPGLIPASISSAIWRGDELAQAIETGVPTGFNALDDELPGGGWPTSTVCELLQPQFGIAEWRLLLPALAGLATPKQPVLVVSPPHAPYFGGLRAYGLSERSLVMVDAESPAERLWVTEQAVRADGLGAVVAWLPHARGEQIRRLQSCSAGNGFPSFLVRPETAEHESSPAALRLQVRIAGIDRLAVHILKRRGAYHEGWLHLDSIPPVSGRSCHRLLHCISTDPDRSSAMIPDNPFWMALLLPATRDEAATLRPDAEGDQQRAIGWWALQFTPRVALLEGAVVLEAAGSCRLFGGEEALRERVRGEALAMGCESVAWAPNASAALALARHGDQDGFASPLPQLLDRLPLEALAAAAEHWATLSRIGCRTLGDVRRLPRGGLSRRFGQSLLVALDCAYGLHPEAFEWLQLPEVFRARLELPSRVEVAEALMFGARRLLAQMAGWLAARHAGVRRFTLRYKHDFHRPRDIPDWGEITICTAETTRETGHFSRLLSEQLSRTRLGASVEELILIADEVDPLEEVSASLLPDDTRDGENVTQLVERLSARLGPDRVLRAIVRSDYRPEWTQAWQPAAEPVVRGDAALPAMPLPTWLLEPPLRLAVRNDKPLYQGPLDIVSGPHRVEAGWWDRRAVTSGEPVLARRDYYAMRSEHAGLLWVFRGLAVGEERRSPWYLHGLFG